MKANGYKAFLCGLRIGLRSALCVCAVMLFFSCASTRARVQMPAEQAVYVTNEKKVALLPPDAIEQSVDAMQHIVAEFRGNTIASDTLLLADEHQIFMTILNSFGTTIGSLVYSDGAVSFESAVLPKSIRASYIVFDIQLCFYRPDALSNALSEAALRFACTADESGAEIRTVYDGEKLLCRIEKHGATISVHNFERNYQYTLTSLE